MMSRACNYILFVFFLIGAIDQEFIASAEETTTDGIIVRPVVEYKSSKLRDPFRTYLIKEEPRQLPQENIDLTKPGLDLGKLKVQGIIWGVATPQAIINNKVLTIGDLIEGAEILSIEKKGITLSFNGAIFDLTAPGRDSVQAEDTRR
ncbi:MAG: hypothetical protein Q8N80_01990 [Candidatus Omnitrophota bacterium]|nr:hypothetical protein [Candidatus Omnitrophota bacterium]